MPIRSENFDYLMDRRLSNIYIETYNDLINYASLTAGNWYMTGVGRTQNAYHELDLFKQKGD